MTRKVCVVTGTRAEYGLLKSPMESIQSSDALELSLVVTGMHLSPQYGNTISEIEADGFEVDRRVEMLIDGDSGLSMAKSTGIGIMGMADAFREIAPDIVLVLGDRDEPLGATIAAAHMNIPVAHVHGGDAMTGATIDDSIRHALTKFAHIHFPASAASAQRITKLGEEDWRIKTVGAPGLDAIRAGKYVPGPTMRDELGIDEERNLILCIQHPVTTNPDAAGEQMRRTLDAVTSFDADIVLVHPNSDAGSAAMRETIDTHPSTSEIVTVRNLSRDRYLGVMDAADVMVGNSSSGIIESPSFDIPVVDVGPRQKRRERAANVVSVAHETAQIREAVEQALHDERVRERAADCENPYDYGGAGDRIVAFLERTSMDDSLLRKEITY